ncbi:DUF5615 family PIN-like protein [Hymenobacter profundi]|uniref:DUF5615 family PIN-like protein n=1 Tax=Hymenobacter profundi TaxID=1982110 RepID=A0ABS6X088_9BACT|nr:DUF5615 family PIN-like protein [Hymenobacter profundi]
MALLRPHGTAVLHVRAIGLHTRPATSIWRYTRQHGYDLPTKDKGFPPCVVAMQHAQVPVAKLDEFLLAQLPQLQEFLAKPQTEFGVLVLWLG